MITPTAHDWRRGLRRRLVNSAGDGYDVTVSAPTEPRRVLLCATTTGYQTRSFDEAAAELGIELVLATDRCDHLDDPWRDRAIPVRFHDEASVE